MKKITTLAYSALLYALPVVALAQGGNSSSGGGNLTPLKNLVRAVGDVLNLLVPVLIALALVVFFWGLVKYVLGSSGGGDDKKAEAKGIMIAGLVSLFVMVSVWGIVRLAQNALGVGPDQISNTPYVPLR